MTTLRAWWRWQDWGNLVLGVWLFVWPLILATTNGSSNSWNAWLVGLGLAVVALWALAAPRSPAADGINVVLGAWLFVATSHIRSSRLTGRCGRPSRNSSPWYRGVSVAPRSSVLTIKAEHSPAAPPPRSPT